MLALALGKTIGELVDLLTDEELTYWREFYRLYPFDDLHRYHRPAALVFSGHAGKEAPTAFESAIETLSPKPKPKQSRRLRPARVIRSKPA